MKNYRTNHTNAVHGSRGNYRSVVFVSVFDPVSCFNFLFRLLNHRPTIGSDTLQNEIRQIIAYFKRARKKFRWGESQLTADISKHGNFPTWAPVNPYTELALIFNASCLPSKTMRLNGSVSFFRSSFAFLRALKRSSRISGNKPFSTVFLTNKCPAGVSDMSSGFTLKSKQWLVSRGWCSTYSMRGTREISFKILRVRNEILLFCEAFFSYPPVL